MRLALTALLLTACVDDVPVFAKRAATTLRPPDTTFASDTFSSDTFAFDSSGPMTTSPFDASGDQLGD